MLNNYKFIDLSQLVHSEIPTWPGSTCLTEKIQKDYEQGCLVFDYQMCAGTGTHIDAPAHFVRNGRTIEQLDLQELIAPVCVIDICENVKINSDYCLSIADIDVWEKNYGCISAGSIVVAHTGWSQYWHDQERYRNMDAAGTLHIPGFSVEAAELLLQRNIAGIGIDTLSLDAGINKTFAVHHLMLGHNKFQIENLTNLDQLPASGAFILALPMKIKGATEAPSRVVALLPTLLEDSKHS